ncbi:hypothetical protein GCM10023079_34960 [Streptomyces chitinivorans]
MLRFPAGRRARRASLRIRPGRRPPDAVPIGPGGPEVAAVRVKDWQCAGGPGGGGGGGRGRSGGLPEGAGSRCGHGFSAIWRSRAKGRAGGLRGPLAAMAHDPPFG